MISPIQFSSQRHVVYLVEILISYGSDFLLAQIAFIHIPFSVESYVSFVFIPKYGAWFLVLHSSMLHKQTNDHQSRFLKPILSKLGNNQSAMRTQS